MSIVSQWLVVSLILALVVRVVILHLLGYQPHRSIITEVFQGLIVGGVLGCFTAEIFARIKTTAVNGWITFFGCAVPGNGMLFQGRLRPKTSRPGQHPAGGVVLDHKQEWRGPQTQRPS
jgi:hypothetical protein